MDPRKVVSREECFKQMLTEFIQEINFMAIFLYNLDVFVWLQHSYLANNVLAFDNNSIIKWLWCIYEVRYNLMKFTGR